MGQDLFEPRAPCGIRGDPIRPPVEDAVLALRVLPEHPREVLDRGEAGLVEVHANRELLDPRTNCAMFGPELTDLEGIDRRELGEQLILLEAEVLREPALEAPVRRGGDVAISGRERARQLVEEHFELLVIDYQTRMEAGGEGHAHSALHPTCPRAAARLCRGPHGNANRLRSEPARIAERIAPAEITMTRWAARAARRDANGSGLRYPWGRMGSAQDVLDRVHSLATLEALEAEPGGVAARLAADLPVIASLSELEARDAMLVDLLGQIDAMIARAMRFKLDHALAADSSIGAPTRSVFASTIVGYANRVPLLAQRARDVAARGRAPDPDAIADVVVAAAHAVLELRAAIRADVLAVIRQLATAAAPEADRRARDRKRSEPERRRWSAARRDLEAVAADPERVLAAPTAARLAALPDELDEPAAEPEPTFKDLLELD